MHRLCCTCRDGRSFLPRWTSAQLWTSAQPAWGMPVSPSMCRPAYWALGIGADCLSKMLVVKHLLPVLAVKGCRLPQWWLPQEMLCPCVDLLSWSWVTGCAYEVAMQWRPCLKTLWWQVWGMQNDFPELIHVNCALWMMTINRTRINLHFNSQQSTKSIWHVLCRDRH